MFKKLTALTLGLCLSMSALAVDVATLTKQAESGNKIAQFNLGIMYFDNKDYAEAVDWYQKSANQGFAEAQYNLG